MLILCLGPDTFRALEKARELEAAFCRKYDANQTSVERIDSGAGALDDLIARMNTGSLFASHRFFRCRDLLSSASKVQLDSLSRVLAQDPERVIVVSVEEGPLGEVLQRWCKNFPKCIQYAFPLLTGNAYVTWLTEIARRFSIYDQKLVEQLAMETEGDTWAASCELAKMAVGGIQSLIGRKDGESVFGLVNQLIAGETGARRVFRDSQRMAELLPILISQLRAAIRVRDRETQGVHPFLIKKMQKLSTSTSLDERFACALCALQFSRLGFGTEADAAPLF